MNWKLDPADPYTWQVEGFPFGVEKIDRACYAPFRLWGKSRVYVGQYDNTGRKDLLFRSRQEAFAYVEEAVKKYEESIIRAV